MKGAEGAEHKSWAVLLGLQEGYRTRLHSFQLDSTDLDLQNPASQGQQFIHLLSGDDHSHDSKVFWDIKLLIFCVKHFEQSLETEALTPV